MPKDKKEKRPNSPATFLQFRKKRDDRKIEELKQTGGTYRTRSRRANNPVGTKQLNKGSTVTSRVSPGKMSHEPLKVTTEPVSERSSKTVFRDVDKQTHPGARGNAIIHTRPTTKENVAEMKERPEKGEARKKAQEGARARLAAGEKVKLGPVTYSGTNYAGRTKEELAGYFEKEHTNKIGLVSKINKPKIKYTPKTTHTTVQEQPDRSGLKKRRNPRSTWLIDREAKHVTKGERKRKKTESGHGVAGKRYYGSEETPKPQLRRRKSK